MKSLSQSSSKSPTSQQHHRVSPNMDQPTHQTGTTIRDRILAMRSAKQQQLESTLLGVNPQPHQLDPHRLTWIGVSDDEPASMASRSPTPHSGLPSRQYVSHHSEDEDDADSTVLGHGVNELPLPPTSHGHAASLRPSRPSSASEQTQSSQASTSCDSLSLDDDSDGRSLLTNATTDDSSNPSSRRGSRCKDSVRLPQQASKPQRPDTAGSVRSVSSTKSRPLCPPPSIPLPPKPAGAPASPVPHSATWRRTSNGSVITVASSRSLSVRRNSSRLGRRESYLCTYTPTGMGLNETNVAGDASASSSADELELQSIRHISSHFPSPVAANGTSHRRASKASSRSHRSDRSSAGLRILSPISSTSSASTSRRQPKSFARTLSSSSSPRVSVAPSEPIVPQCDSEPDEGDMSDSALEDVLDITEHQGILSVARKASSSHLSRATVGQVGLGVLAQASRTSSSRPRPSSASSEGPKPAAESSQVQVIAQERPDNSHEDVPALTPSNSNSADLSTSSPRPVSGESYLAPSINSAVDINAILDAYRASNGTLASHFTAPVLRIQDPEGEDVSDSELDLSSDDAPRKRTKQNRRKALGFDEQRATVRPTGSAPRSFRPGQIFSYVPLIPPRSDSVGSAVRNKDASTTKAATPPTTRMPLGDPYAYYEFSPSLPPFVPSGLSPRDLTGTGTWSSIVARASERMNNPRQPSMASLASLATVSSTSGPVSMRAIRAAAKAKQAEAEAARREREELSTHVAALSYRPFAIHDHALSLLAGRTSSPDPSQQSCLTRTSSGSRSVHGGLDYAGSDTGELGTRWPIAVGSDDGDSHYNHIRALSSGSGSFYGLNGASLSRQGSEQSKTFVEFSMQTSPTIVQHPLPEVAVEAQAMPACTLPEVGHGPSLLDATPDRLTRRKSSTSLLSVHGVDLDKPGAWPTKLRAPRLSSPRSLRQLRTSPQSTEKCLTKSKHNHDDTMEAHDHDAEVSESDEESDLDVEADLEALAERSGVLDEVRGAKRKLHDSGKPAMQAATAQRRIASIPMRYHHTSPSQVTRRVSRASSSAGWTSSEEEDDESASSRHRATTTPSHQQSRPSLLNNHLRSTPVGSTPPIRRSYSMSMTATTSPGPGAAIKASRSSQLLARSQSPDLSILTNESEDEEVLLTADIDLDHAVLAKGSLIDDQFDLMVGRSLSTRFTPAATAATSKVTINQQDQPQHVQRRSSVGSSSDFHSASSNEDVMELLRQADELLSSTGHSIGHSSSHEGTVSDSGGTSGHDPQRPNQILAEIVKQRLALRMRGLLSDNGSDTLASAKKTHDDPASLDEDCLGNAEQSSKTATDASHSPALQDTPDTMAGSEIWTSFHADRASTASTATTWSDRSSKSPVEMMQHKLLHTKAADDTAVSDTSSATDLANRASKLSLAVAAVEQVSGDRIGRDGHQPEISEAEEAATAACSSTVSRSGSAGSAPRKASGLPVSSRIAAPLLSKAAGPANRNGHTGEGKPVRRISDQTEVIRSNKTVRAPMLRRHQSLANLQAPTSAPSQIPALPKTAATCGATPSKMPLRWSGNVASPAGPSSLPRAHTPPSKLPGLRATASTTSLRTRASTMPLRAHAACEASPTSSIPMRKSIVRTPATPRPSGLPVAASRSN
ncbi:hypothetical protein BCV70DRAFT_219808 [Testicularia cyperi]|uniref:Uncharacterized protein n=1 Tax=Testicularia cyperi TaxID=1882483 RepID=A0A317XF13_9BASI|nr:hypothetical protein BCV70DRAFT_219808 [Testicularia cyperi]